MTEVVMDYNWVKEHFNFIVRDGKMLVELTPTLYRTLKNVDRDFARPCKWKGNYWKG